MATPTRQGTMQATAEEAKEFLSRNHGDCPHGTELLNDREKGHSDKAARQGTMQATAEEGIAYLKDKGKDALLKVQGLLPDGEKEKNGSVAVEKQGTMAATAKEAEDVLDRMGGAPDAEVRTRGQQKEKKKEEEEEEPVSKKPKITKESTMAATAKEAKQLLEEEALGETRGETAAMKKAEEEETDETTGLRKTGTMIATTAEAHSILEGEELGDSRSETAAIKKAEEERPKRKSPRDGKK